MLKSDLMNWIENPDNALAMEAQAGDSDAEEALLRKYSSLVRNKAKAYYMVGADSDDVMQEGWIGLLKAVRKYSPDRDSSFETFADICITSQIITAIRSSCRNKHKPLNTSLSLNGPIPGGEDSEENLTLGDTLKADITDSPEEKVIIKDVTYYILNNGDNIFSDFEMKVLTEFIKGYSCQQIAERLGKTSKSIDNALQRTKKKINDYLWA